MHGSNVLRNDDFIKGFATEDQKNVCFNWTSCSTVYTKTTLHIMPKIILACVEPLSYGNLLTNIWSTRWKCKIYCVFVTYGVVIILIIFPSILHNCASRFRSLSAFEDSQYSAFSIEVHVTTRWVQTCVTFEQFTLTVVCNFEKVDKNLYSFRISMRARLKTFQDFFVPW